MKKIIILLVILLSVKAKGQMCFNPYVSYTTGITPFSICKGDFNGDGKPDLAVANAGNNNVSIRLNTGTGSFAAATNFTVGSYPVSVVSADFNGDGKKDLATANRSSNNVSVIFGNGTGGFSAATNFTVPSGPVWIESGDFNGDGSADLATTNYTANNVSVLMNTGTGSFGSAISYTAGNRPVALVSADLNGDTFADLAVCNSSGANVSILLGSVTGTFSAPTNFSAPNGPEQIISADFNADGNPDLAVGLSGSATFHVLLGTGGGNFGAPTTYPATQFTYITSADFDGDSKLDLAVGSQWNTSVYLGTGAGTFGSAINICPGTGSSILSGDFNGDGKQDVVSVNYGGNYFMLLLNGPMNLAISNTSSVSCSGVGVSLVASGATTYTWSANAGSVTSPTANVTPSINTIYTVSGTNGSCTNTQTIAVTVVSGPTLSVATSTTLLCIGASATLTASGATTYSWNSTPASAAIVVSPTVNTTYTVKGKNSSGCTSSLTITQNVQSCTGSVCYFPATNYSVGINPVAIINADLNNDGKNDLAVANANTNNVSIRLGTGAGSFGTVANFAVGTSPSCITSADFNGDGKLDLAVGNGNSANISLLLGTGTGNFTPGGTIALPALAVPWSIISADLNGDGNKDLACGYSPASGSPRVAIFLGTGVGTFGAISSFTSSNIGAPWGIVSADLNGDTKLDLATANYGDNTMSVLFGTGTGSFSAATSYPASIQPVSIVATDLNGDANLDLVTANFTSSGNVSVFLGTGAGAFGAANTIFTPTGNYATSVISGDFDGDGKMDVAVANGVVTVLLGIGTGVFGLPVDFNVGFSPNSLTSYDFNSDGKLDLATANSNSNDASVLLSCGVLGITPFRNEREIKIYPNPNSGNIIIETNSSEKQGMQVIDVSGKIILSQVISDKETIETSKLQNGIYFVIIKTTEGALTEKIIVQH